MVCMRSVYHIAVETNSTFPTAQYATTAARMVGAYQVALADAGNLALCTQFAELTRAEIEVDVRQYTDEPETTIIASCFLDLEADRKVPFDKNKFTGLFRAEVPFGVKVSKRAVPKEELLEDFREPEA